MAHNNVIDFSVDQVKSSLDELNNSLTDDGHSTDALIRLSKALREINEEVHLLQNIMQVGKKV